MEVTVAMYLEIANICARIKIIGVTIWELKEKNYADADDTFGVAEVVQNLRFGWFGWAERANKK